MTDPKHVDLGSRSKPEGAVGLIPLYGGQFRARPFRSVWREFLEFGTPSEKLSKTVNVWRFRNWKHLYKGLNKVLLLDMLHLPGLYGKLNLLGYVGESGIWLPFGLASLRVVTTAGVNALVDALQNLVEPELFRYHGIGIGTTAEAVGDTALVTELTTEYNPNSTRVTGSLTEGASANIFRTVGTNTLDSGTPAITEHGIFTQAATGGGTLLDRSVFSAINLNGTNGDGLQSTYDLTLTAGS